MRREAGAEEDRNMGRTEMSQWLSFYTVWFLKWECIAYIEILKCKNNIVITHVLKMFHLQGIVEIAFYYPEFVH